MVSRGAHHERWNGTWSWALAPLEEIRYTQTWCSSFFQAAFWPDARWHYHTAKQRLVSEPVDGFVAFLRDKGNIPDESHKLQGWCTDNFTKLPPTGHPHPRCAGCCSSRQSGVGFAL